MTDLAPRVHVPILDAMYSANADLETATERYEDARDNLRGGVEEAILSARALANIVREQVLTLLDDDDEDMRWLVTDVSGALETLAEELKIIETDTTEADAQWDDLTNKVRRVTWTSP